MSITTIIVVGKVRGTCTTYIGKRDNTGAKVWSVRVQYDDISDVSFVGTIEDFGPLAVLLDEKVVQADDA